MDSSHQYPASVSTEYGNLTRVVSGGGSGGAMMQLSIANNYPGLLDGITPALEFPDMMTALQTVHDCALFSRVFAADTGRWTPTRQKRLDPGPLIITQNRCSRHPSSIPASQPPI
ncbi:DUF6351 family protein [Arthrobacter ramosus]|uniref:DUF6351 family protein n=1 Tax=Arthrobacter ramosus TaxID=1672 RepID=A0ABV5Y4K4_ARTRM|nr:DUF6351 family protein [Arthrobacter ramosus]